MKTLLALYLAFISTAVLAEFKIENAWVKNAPLVVPVRAAYLTLVNKSNEKVIIKKITSPQFKSIEAHATVYRNSVYSMHPLHNLYIAPNSTLELKPRGKHLMLMMPTKPLIGLNHIQLNFHTQQGKVILVNAPIKDSL